MSFYKVQDSFQVYVYSVYPIYEISFVPANAAAGRRLRPRKSRRNCPSEVFLLVMLPCEPQDLTGSTRGERREYYSHRPHNHPLLLRLVLCTKPEPCIGSRLPILRERRLALQCPLAVSLYCPSRPNSSLSRPIDEI